jgi:hypothetical protein
MLLLALPCTSVGVSAYNDLGAGRIVMKLSERFIETCLHLSVSGTIGQPQTVYVKIASFSALMCSVSGGTR